MLLLLPKACRAVIYFIQLTRISLCFDQIIGFAIRNKLLIGLFIVALVGYGSYQFTRLPIDTVPDITNNQVQVITIAPSFGATDIERLVTFPIEQANNNIPGLKEIRSFSRFGLSLVTIVFDDATDIYWASTGCRAFATGTGTDSAGIGIPELGPVSTGLVKYINMLCDPNPVMKINSMKQI